MAVTLKKVRKLASGLSRRRTRPVDAESHSRQLGVVQRRNDFAAMEKLRNERRAHITGKPLDRRQVVVVTVDVTVDATVSVFVALDASGRATSTTTLNPLSFVTRIPSLDVVVETSVLDNAPSQVTAVVNTIADTTIPSSNSHPVASIASGLVPSVAKSPSSTAIPDNTLPASQATNTNDATPFVTTTPTNPNILTALATTTPVSLALSSTTGIAALPPSLNVTSNTTTSSIQISSLVASNLSTILLNYSSPSTLLTTSGSSSIIAPATISSTVSAHATPATAKPGSSSAAASSNANGNGLNGDSSSNQPSVPTPPPVIAGAVTGSVGAAAIFIVLLWLFLRWYRKRTMGSNALDGDRSMAHLKDGGSRSNRAMTERGSFLPSAAASFISRRRHRALSPALPSAEQGFQKVMGRKMPSQFGMDANEAPMVRNFEAERQWQHRSMFVDAAELRESRLGVGEGRSAYDPEAPAEWETVMPSPARTPMVRSTDPFLDPPSGPPTPFEGHNATVGYSPSRVRISQSARFSGGHTNF